MTAFLDDIRLALRQMPNVLVLTLTVAIALSLGTAFFHVEDAALILPLPGCNQGQMALAVLVSRTGRGAMLSSPGHLQVRAKVRPLKERADFVLLGEVAVHGPRGTISLAGAWPGRREDCDKPVEERAA